MREEGLVASAPPGEAILDPGQPIIDAHHHLYERPGIRYLVDDYIADLDRGHDVRATVFVQARAGYRVAGPIEMRSVGETAFAREAGEWADAHGQARYGIAAAIVSHADLTLGDCVRPVLEAHLEAGGGRVRGIRQIAAWDADASLLNPAYPTDEDMLDRPEFRAGFRQLAPLGLSFDAWLFFPQLPKLARLAQLFPDTAIVLDHCGGILGVGGYAGRGDEVFMAWSAGLAELARCPNVMVKLSGLGMPSTGIEVDRDGDSPLSHLLAEAWRPWMESCIDMFGTRRAMFASNFPADRAGYPYAIGWNAMKRLAREYSEDEQAELFWRSASTFYRLPPLA